MAMIPEEVKPTIRMRQLVPPTRRPILAGRYELMHEIGAGGMSTVYLGRDLRLERLVAVKVLEATDPHLAQRFHREAMLLASIESPYVVPVYDVDASDRPFLVMRYIQGETLAQVLATSPRSIDAVDTVIELLYGLRVLHTRRILHRDLKPSNVMRQADGQIVLLDLGVARDARRSVITRPGTIIGTVEYMSPEQARGEHVDERSDIFQVGWILAHLLVGCTHKPKVEQLVELPTPLRDVVQRAVGERDRRFRDVQEMLLALERGRRMCAHCP